MMRTIYSHIFLIFLISCSTLPFTDQYYIETVIEKDRELYKVAQESIESENMSEVEALSQMVDSMQSIDLSGTPEDFRVAYWNHTLAWKDAIKQIERRQSNVFTSMILGIFGLFSGQTELTMNSLISLLSQKGVDMSGVNETWDIVESSAIKHGARIK